MAGLLRTLWLPLLLLLAAHLLIPAWQDLPRAFRPLSGLAPYAAALLAVVTAAAFNQGRTALTGALLALAYWSLESAVDAAHADPFRAATFYAACTVLVPLNVLLLRLLPERGLLTSHGLLRMLLLALQLLAVAVILLREISGPLILVGRDFLPPLIASAQMPDAGLLAFVLALALSGWLLWRQASILDGGLVVALLALLLAGLQVADTAAVEAYLTAGGLVLAITLVLQTHHIAYRDDLTGLPSRRALNQRLDSLGRRYSIAMLDGDHFQQCTDPYGHEVGDQVLRMVAGRLRQVRGGGKPYRYGGEEFTIVFPGKPVERVMEALEDVRQSIEEYRMVLRDRDRPANKRQGKAKRGHRDGRAQTVSVTISIGVAERTETLRTPDAVLVAADKALYRAKKTGRNRLST
ncbi:MAG: GGDEF domain-containing protein [Ectothiorhodospiraceae bacterium]|nr:GGDEF domain-containing protein [Ectothiorhodospiraceae bacterium]